MLANDPFNIAPHAPRLTRAGWLCLVLGSTFLLLCSGLLVRGWRDMPRLHDADPARANALPKPDAAALEKAQAQQKLQDRLRMSWTGLFDACESAAGKVDGGASIVSLNPGKIQGDAVEVGVTVVALSGQVMLDYIRALQTHPQVREVRLATQQPGTQVVAPALRFQLTVLWAPRAASALGSAQAFLSALPPLSSHLEDVSALLSLASSHQVALGSVSYSTESAAPLPLTVRHAELRVNEDYPKLKAFIAEVLLTMPHLYLDDIRFESGAASTKLLTTLRLSLVYRSTTGAAEAQVEAAPVTRLADAVGHNPFAALNAQAGAVSSALDEAKARALLPPPKAPPKASPAVAPTAAPPPPPLAPPLPFAAVGSIAGAGVTGGEQVAFIRHQEQLLLVKAGDTIGSQYRVEAVTTQQVEFTYLPLMQRQALSMTP